MPPKQDVIVLRQMAEELFAIQTLASLIRSQSRRRGAVDLTEAEFLTLDVLWGHDGPMSVGEIQKAIGVLPAQMSRIIRALEKRPDGALISCKINRHDKRKIDVQLTREGRTRHKTYKDVRQEALMDYLQFLNHKDCREFMRICRVIRGSIESQLPR